MPKRKMFHHLWPLYFAQEPGNLTPALKELLCTALREGRIPYFQHPREEGSATETPGAREPSSAHLLPSQSLLGSVIVSSKFVKCEK